MDKATRLSESPRKANRRKPQNAKRQRRRILALLLFAILLILFVLFLIWLSTFKIFRPPNASFTSSSNRPLVNEEVTFNASASNDPDGWIVSYLWNFSDGTILSKTNPIVRHSYSTLGNYTVALTVIDNDNKTDSITQVLTVRRHPFAFFTYEPPIIHVGDEVHFNASGSTGNGGYIVSYKWNFGDTNITTSSELKITHIYTSVGVYEVTLTVIDSEEIEDSTSKLIEVIELPPVIAIDVYTQYPYPFGGQGLGTNSDAFAPEDLIKLFANVTYNTAPIHSVQVLFDIHDPAGNSITRNTITNESGIATTNFAIPSPSRSSNNTIFGTWFVFASVKIGGQKANDSLTFPVGWIVELFKMETVDAFGTPKSSFHKGELVYFNLYIKNIALVEKEVTLTIVVYDNLSVVIGQVALNDIIVPPKTSLVLTVNLQIPTTAFIGTATAYANALTNMPSQGGAPYSPEKTVTFEIKRQ